MPAPARTSLEAIVASARSVLAQDGADAVTMRRLADEAGIKAPSLYRHVANRGALLRLVIEDLAAEIRAALETAGRTEDAAEDLRAMAHALRRFARRDPHAFALIFAPSPDAGPVDAGVYATAAAPLVEATSRLVGPDRSLDAARTLTAWATGFLGMELAGAFHLGGSVDEAYRYGADLLVDALEARRS